MFRKFPLSGRTHPETDAGVAQAPNPVNGEVPEQVTHSLKTQGDAMIQYGARLLVQRELLATLSAAMPGERRAIVEAAFRRKVDDLLSLADDRHLPETFHSALLAEINFYLDALKS